MISVPPRTIYLVGETGNQRLAGKIYPLLAPLLDGRHHPDELVDLLSGKVQAEEVYLTLLKLERQGLLEEGSEALDPAAAAFWSANGVEPQAAAESLAQKRVALITFGEVPGHRMEQMLQASGLRLGSQEESALWVVLASDYLLPGLEKLNAAALTLNKPWLLVKPNGLTPWIGPLFVPGASACWKCLETRLRSNRQEEHFIQVQATINTPFVTPSALPSTLDTALSLASTAAARYVVREGDSVLEGKLLTFDTSTFQTHEHELVRRPQCSACGQAHPKHPEPLVLRSELQTLVGNGGYRTASAATTWENYRPHVSPLTGVVKRLERVGQDHESLIQVYMSDFNVVKADQHLEQRFFFRGNSAGKGKTELEARVSGLCEALERYSGVFRGEEYRFPASYRALESKNPGAGIHPNKVMLFSAAQYAGREEWNAVNDAHQFVPNPFDEEAEIEWTPVWSLSDQKFKYLPAAFCYFHYPSLPGQTFCKGDSNGSASGNSYEEAAFQGFLELAERDAVAIWWYNRLSRPAVDLASFGEPYFDELLCYYASLNRDLWVLDLSHDLDIPSFVAISAKRPGGGKIIMGFGAHLDPKIGITRALTEANQQLVNMDLVEQTLAHANQKNLRFDNTALRWWREATLNSRPYLAPAPQLPVRRQNDFSHLSSGNLGTDLKFCQAQVEQLGLEMLVLDQTRPDIGLKVVKVIVPGLRHFWARFASGRLYDVPVRLGWCDCPLAERDLNPIPMFY